MGNNSLNTAKRCWRRHHFDDARHRQPGAVVRLAGNLVEMFNDTAILIILALGQMMVLLTKGIDCRWPPTWR
jgi:hypothetical protein